MVALGKWFTCVAELCGGDWRVNRNTWTGPPYSKYRWSHVGGLELGMPCLQGRSWNLNSVPGFPEAGGRYRRGA